ASFPFQINPCNPVESDTPDSLGHQWVYSEKDNRIIAARDNELCIYSISVCDDSYESTLAIELTNSYALSSPIKSITYNSTLDRVCILVGNRCELLYPVDLAKGEYKSFITPFKKDASCCYCLQGSLLFCGSDTITRISFTGQTSEKSFSHPILSIDTLNDSIALLLSNGEVVFLSGSDLRETSRVTVPCVTESSLCTLLWGEASHLLLGVASASL
ncbi:hypothetical protein WA588_002078, partial [Blastocystis sp. NMH]